MQKRRLFHILILLAMLAMMFATNVASSNALSVPGDSQIQTQYNKLNLLIIVRASKSINGSSVGEYGKPKIKLLQEIIESTIKGYSFPSNVDIGILAYGHIVDRSNFNASCASGNVEMVAPFATPLSIDYSKFKSISGLGESPSAVALQEAAKYFTDPNALNTILLIADGGDTCFQDSVATAKALVNEKNIQIYTIGLKVGTDNNDELSGIASSPENYFNVPRSANTEEKYVTALTTQFNYVFDKLVNQISTLPASVITTPPPIETTTTPSSTPTIGSTPPSITPITPQAIVTTPVVIVPTEPPAEIQTLSGILIVGIIGLVALLIIGFFYLNLNLKSSKIKDNKNSEVLNGQNFERSRNTTVKTDNEIISGTDLEKFYQDIQRTYSLIEKGDKYIPLVHLKQKLSNSYHPDEFEKLLILLRQKYSNKIWIDKDSRGDIIIKIIS